MDGINGGSDSNRLQNVGDISSGVVPPEAATTADKEAYIALMKQIQDLMAKIKAGTETDDDAKVLSDALNQLKKMEDENRLPSHMLYELNCIFPFFDAFLAGSKYLIPADKLSGLLNTVIDMGGDVGAQTLNQIFSLIKGEDHSLDDLVTTGFAWEVAMHVDGEFQDKQAKFKELLELSKGMVGIVRSLEDFQSLVQFIEPDPCRLPTTSNPFTSFNDIPQWIIKHINRDDWVQFKMNGPSFYPDPRTPDDETSSYYMDIDDYNAYVLSIRDERGKHLSEINDRWDTLTPQQQSQAIDDDLAANPVPRPDINMVGFVLKPPSARQKEIFDSFTTAAGYEKYESWRNAYVKLEPQKYLPNPTPQQVVDTLNQIQDLQKLFKQLESQNADKSPGSLYDTTSKLLESLNAIMKPIKDSMTNWNQDFKDNCYFIVGPNNQIVATNGTNTIGVQISTEDLSKKVKEWFLAVADDDTVLKSLETAITSFNTTNQNQNAADQTKYQSNMEQIMNILRQLFDIFKSIRGNIGR